VAADLKGLRPFNEMPEEKLSSLSVPRLRATVAILQDYAEPESYSVVDFTLALRLSEIDRQTCQVISLIDGRRSIQEIADEVSGGSNIEIGQETLEFFRSLRSRQVIEF
jgi:hypothetical protein